MRLAQEGDPVHLRHVHVGDAERNLALALEHRERLDAGARFEGGEAVALDDAGQGMAHRAVVVHDQTAGGRSRASGLMHAPKVSDSAPALQPSGASCRPPRAGRYASASSSSDRPAMTRILPDDDQHGFATRAVHAGQVIEPLAGAVMTPIYQTSTYVQEALGKHKATSTPGPRTRPARRWSATWPAWRAATRLRVRLRARRARRGAQAASSRRSRRLRRERLRRHPAADGADLRGASGSSSPSWTCATWPTWSARSRPPPAWSTARRPPTR